MAAELACERRSWRVASPLGRTRVAPPSTSAPRSRTSSAGPVVAGLLLLGVVLAPAGLVAAEVAGDPGTSWGQVVLWPAVAVVVLVGLFTAHVLGTAWWVNGAGEPVLSVADGTVRGRLSAARRRPPAYDGWDFEVPLARITNARVTEAGHVAFDLPADVAQELCTRPTTTAHARHWRRTVGTPAAWPAGRMLRGADRRARLDRLVAALRADDAHRSAEAPGERPRTQEGSA